MTATTARVTPETPAGTGLTRDRPGWDMTAVRSVRIRPGSRWGAAALSDLINRAFFDLPANAYLVPHAGDRMAVMGRYLALHVAHALAGPHSVVDVACDESERPVGVAIWSAHTDPGPPNYDARLADAVPAELLTRFQTFDALMHEPIPHGAHCHLGFLAVEPDLRSRGIGGALLEAGHRRVERTGLPGWLVASGERARRLYLRHGYTPAGVDVVLPDRSRMYPMMRASARASARTGC